MDDMKGMGSMRCPPQHRAANQTRLSMCLRFGEQCEISGANKASPRYHWRANKVLPASGQAASEVHATCGEGVPNCPAGEPPARESAGESGISQCSCFKLGWAGLEMERQRQLGPVYLPLGWATTEEGSRSISGGRESTRSKERPAEEAVSAHEASPEHQNPCK